MGVKHHEGDFNLDKIAKLTKSINDAETEVEYYVYGMTTNHDVHISLERSAYHEPDEYRVGDFRYWLEQQGILAIRVRQPHDVDEGEERVMIGLRRDLRNDHKFCAALIKTMVLWFEGKLKGGLDYGFKLPNPKMGDAPANV